jgi:N-acetylglucosamine kinase-like BadF-type ATPase
VAARGLDGKVHYAGGTGWRFGDAGSGYDLGRRAVARALLELQGWETPTRLGPLVRAQTQLGDSAEAGAVTRFFYQHAEPNRQIAALAPGVLTLAQEGDVTAQGIVDESMVDLLALAGAVAKKLFPGRPLAELRAGVSGPILNHPVVLRTLGASSPLKLVPVTGAPIEGVRRLVMRG